MITMTSEMTTLKTRLKATWEAGDYGHFAQYLEPGALEFLARIPLKPGVNLLDTACGAGQISIPAARAGANVTGIDIAANSIDQARARAQSEGLNVRFDEGDVEDLPYADASFDIVVSLIGAMFAPRPDRVAAEMLRVCRPGGRIVMANWTPEGFVGQMFKTIGKYLPPPAGVKSPALWGTREWLETAFRAEASAIVAAPRFFVFRYRSAQHFLDVFRRYYGPMLKAFEALDERGRAGLTRDVIELIGRFNRSDDDTMVVPGEYLEVVVARR
jgi:ubiquinone/menaquinone biosynthesis C-methylase UbiE